MDDLGLGLFAFPVTSDIRTYGIDLRTALNLCVVGGFSRHLSRIPFDCKENLSAFTSIVKPFIASVSPFQPSE